MDQHIFLEGSPGPDFRFGYEPCLFSTIEFQQLQAPAGWVRCHLAKEKLITGGVTFHIAEGIARSPLAAPFGSFEFAPGIAPKTKFDFILKSVGLLSQKGCSKIIIKGPPSYSQHEASFLNVSLLNIGFTISNAEASSLLSVSKRSFESMIDVWEVRKLKQAVAAGLMAKKLAPEKFGEVFDLIASCRTKKNYALSMTKENLSRMTAAFPDNYILHGVFEKEKLVAASIGILVKPEVFYNFYSDHDNEFDHVSPAVLLMRELYGFCQQQKISILDLGTSAIGNMPNFGLLEFKMRLGANLAEKYTFEKNCD